MECKIFLDGTAKIKAWFYNKPENQEVVLVDEKTNGGRNQVLRLFDQRVGQWVQQNLVPVVSPEDNQ